METEIKLSPVSAHTAGQVFGDPLLVPFLGDARRTDMESIYYTDREGALARAGAALRLRRENGDGVCCLKIKAGRQGLADVRQEFEIPAEDVGEGAYRLSRLPDMPFEAAEALKNPSLDPVCRCDFTRTEADYRSETLEFTLSYDIGEYKKGELSAPMGELELELRRGDPLEMDAICRALMEKYALAICEVSKYARAMSLEAPAEENTDEAAQA